MFHEQHNKQLLTAICRDEIPRNWPKFCVKSIKPSPQMRMLWFMNDLQAEANHITSVHHSWASFAIFFLLMKLNVFDVVCLNQLLLTCRQYVLSKVIADAGSKIKKFSVFDVLHSYFSSCNQFGTSRKQQQRCVDFFLFVRSFRIGSISMALSALQWNWEQFLFKYAQADSVVISLSQYFA